MGTSNFVKLLLEKWGEDAHYSWEADKARLKITFKFWDGQSRDAYLCSEVLRFN